MMESVLSFFLARQMFFSQGTLVFFVFVLACLLASLKWRALFRVALYISLAYALEQAFFFYLSSFLQDEFISLSFSSGLAEGVIAACYGLLSALILPQHSSISPRGRVVLCVGVLFVLVNLDRFVFHNYAFLVILLSVILAMRLAVSLKTADNMGKISGENVLNEIKTVEDNIRTITKDSLSSIATLIASEFSNLDKLLENTLYAI